MGLILNKKDWHTKYKNDEIVSKWRNEIGKKYRSSLDYCLRVLEFFEDFYHRNNDCIECTHIDYVYKSDNLINNQLKLQLIDQVNQMEFNIFKQNKQDWHPNSSEQVLDLVHPSLHCFVFGKTLVNEKQKHVQKPKRKKQ